LAPGSGGKLAAPLRKRIEKKSQQKEERRWGHEALRKIMSFATFPKGYETCILAQKKRNPYGLDPQGKGKAP